jgi:hypothetical protein
MQAIEVKSIPDSASSKEKKSLASSVGLSASEIQADQQFHKSLSNSMKSIADGETDSDVEVSF